MSNKEGFFVCISKTEEKNYDVKNEKDVIQLVENFLKRDDTKLVIFKR